jgi:thioredoxin reductase (NADPH)
MKKDKVDLLIIGAGPAGLGSALYAVRAGLDCKIVDKRMAGGQIINTEFIENYPGFKDNISGYDFIQNLVEHCKKFNINIDEYFDINSIELVSNANSFGKNQNSLNYKELRPYKFNCYGDDAEILSRALIVATGASPSKLSVEGEDELIGKGISFCATCDGALYRDREVVVVGGGDMAIEEAIFLTKFAKKVYIIHRRDELRAVKILQDRVFKNKKIEILWDSVIEKFSGEERLKEITIKNKKRNQSYNKKIDGVFEFVGIKPNSDFVKSMVKMDNRGFIITDYNMETSTCGLFAVGDIRSKPLRQVVTAVADGATAAMSANKYLNNLL